MPKIENAPAMDPEKIKYHLRELEEVHAELSCAISALFAVWEAMAHGMAGEKEYSDALYSVYSTIRCSSDYLQDHIHALLTEMGVDAS